MPFGTSHGGESNGNKIKCVFSICDDSFHTGNYVIKRAE
jgi:hypothetical protein